MNDQEWRSMTNRIAKKPLEEEIEKLKHQNQIMRQALEKIVRNRFEDSDLQYKIDIAEKALRDIELLEAKYQVINTDSATTQNREIF